MCRSNVKHKTTRCGLHYFTRLFHLIAWSQISLPPYLFHISLFSTTDCFNSSGTHLWAPGSTDCNNTITLSTTTQPLCPNSHKASIPCSTQVDCCLPTSWSGTGALAFPWLLPIAGFIAAWHGTSHSGHTLPGSPGRNCGVTAGAAG